MLSDVRLFFVVYFLSCDGGAIFTSESGALLAYLQMQIGVTLYLQPAFFSVHKRRNTVLRNKTRIWHPQNTCVLCWIIYFFMLKQCCLVEQEMYKWNRVISDMDWTLWRYHFPFVLMFCTLPRCARLGTNAKLHLGLQGPPNVLPLGWLFVAAEMLKVDWIKVAMVTMHCIINFFKAWVPMNTRELVWKWWPNQWPVDLHRVAKTAHPQQSSLWRTLSLFKQSGNCDYWVGIEAKQAYRLLWKTSVSCHLV